MEGKWDDVKEALTYSSSSSDSSEGRATSSSSSFFLLRVDIVYLCIDGVVWDWMKWESVRLGCDEVSFRWQ
jgi:hypothetical protein